MYLASVEVVLVTRSTPVRPSSLDCVMDCNLSPADCSPNPHDAMAMHALCQTDVP